MAQTLLTQQITVQGSAVTKPKLCGLGMREQICKLLLFITRFRRLTISHIVGAF